MDEKDFINEGVKKDPSPLFYYGLVLLIVIGGITSLRYWEKGYRQEQLAMHGELRVTHRDFQLFLFQHPQFMRIHTKQKSGYLVGFDRADRGQLDPRFAEEPVKAPPELLYRYHRWKQVLGGVLFSRPITSDQWALFFQDNPAWRVEKEQRTLQQAYIGWLNYYEEGEAINALPITYADVRALVAEYPGFAPDVWKDLEPEYVLDGEGEVPTGTLPSFVRVAIFNQAQSMVTKPSSNAG